jgi:hypothetical protein
MRVFLVLAGAAALSLLHVPTSFAAESIAMPFIEGEAVRVIQGYNDGTHQGASHHGLDLVLAHNQTSGAQVLSPIDGNITWAMEPGAGNGCISVLGKDGLGVMLCHVLLDRPFTRGEKIARGQVLGTVGEAGTLGNNGSPHVHMELQVGGRNGNGVAFGGDQGLPLEGHDLPASGARNEHASLLIASSNTVSAPPPQDPPASARQRQQPARATQNQTRCAPGQTPKFVFGFADLKARLGSSIGDPVTCEFADPNGTGDVHQQTTKGLAFWRKGSNTPTFTNGNEHWGHTPGGWVYWTGESVDPPTTAQRLGSGS